MELDFAQQRQQAHLLIDVLPEEKLSAVHNLLEVLVEPLSRSLAMAPVEEEDLTPETAAALDRARASLARGEGVSHEEVLREFGLGVSKLPRNACPSSGRSMPERISAPSTARPHSTSSTALTAILSPATAT